MSPHIVFSIVLIAILLIVIFLDVKYGLMRDDSFATIKPYSFARVQLTWWTVIIISSFITIFLCKCDIPTFDQSTLILLGISAATTATARITDISDNNNAAKNVLAANQVNQNQAAPSNPNPPDPNNPNPPALSNPNPSTTLSRNNDGENFILDLLKDNNGVSMHRFQTVAFNLVFGLWFISQVWKNLANTGINISNIMPVIEPKNLILIGLSAGTYVALKTTENK